MRLPRITPPLLALGLAACAHPKAPVTPAPTAASTTASAGQATTEGVSAGFQAPTASRHTFLHRQSPSDEARITVTYQDSDIRDVIAAFAAFSGRTIVVRPDVQGTVTAEVHDEPWDIALQSILTLQQLTASEDQSGIITVQRGGEGSAGKAM